MPADQEIIETLWGAFWKLTEHQRRIVMLVYWDGHSISEAAEILHRSPQTLYNTLSHAYENLKNNLGSDSRKSAPKSLVHMRGKVKEIGAAPRNTHTSDKNAVLLPCFPDVPSLHPTPDQYLGSPERGPYMAELFMVHALPFIECGPQHPLHTEWMGRIKRHRQMIARSQETERAIKVARAA